MLRWTNWTRASKKNSTSNLQVVYVSKYVYVVHNNYRLMWTYPSYDWLCIKRVLCEDFIMIVINSYCYC